MARIVVTRPLPGPALERLSAAGHDVHVREATMPPAPDELAALVRDADALLCTLNDRIDAALLDAAPHLRAIAVYAVGVDNVDLAAAAAHGIAVGNTPGVLTDATADLTMALLLAAARHLPAALDDVRGGHWRTWVPTGFLGLELRDARLCIYGPGRIGRAVADRAAAFGMTVRFVGRTDDLHAALAESDVISLHAPLTADTHHVIDAAALAAMPPGGILVNTARGGLVDQVALAASLHAGHLAAAALDVTDPEPLPADDALLKAPGVLVVPHIGSATHRAREAMADRAARNLLAALAGDAMPWPAPAPTAGD